MRDRQKWLKPLTTRHALREAAGLGLEKSDVIRLARFELTCELLRRVAPQSPAEALQGFLSVYEVPCHERISWTGAEEHMCGNAAVLIPEFTRRRYWRQERAWYATLPVRVRLFEVPVDDKPVVSRSSSILTERQACFDEALVGILERRRGKRPLGVEEGIYQFTDRYGVRQTFTVSPDMEEVLRRYNPDDVPGEDRTLDWISNRQPDRTPWKVADEEIRAAAKALQQINPSGDWVGRYERVILEHFDKTPEMTIQRFTHLGGVVSAGKSTLITLLLQVAKKAGKHVTLIVNDKATAIRTVKELSETGIIAIPVLGATNQEDHVERLTKVERKPVWLIDNPALRYLGGACLLLDSGEYGLGNEPCFGLSKPDHEGKNRRYGCPFLPVCPRFRLERELPSADVWVTTVEGLAQRRLKSRSDEWLMAEMVYRYSDLVISDEIDAMQERAEDLFSDSEVLEGDTSLSSLARLNNRVHEAIRERKMLPVTDPAVREFNTTLRRVNSAMEQLYAWLIPHKCMHYRFTSWSELSRLASMLSGWDPEREDRKGNVAAQAHHQVWIDRFTAFLDDPFGTEEDAPDPDLAELRRLARLICEDPDFAWRPVVSDWAERNLFAGRRKTKDTIPRITEAAFLALVSTRLERAIKDATAMGTIVGVRLDLDPDETDLLPHRLTGYDGIIPEPPTGALLEFQFVRDRSTGDRLESGILRYNQIVGNGRIFLLNFHRLYRRLDLLDGPHVLALSGTSYAPGSFRHHIQQEPSGLILPTQQVLDGLKIHCDIWTPESGPIRISGMGRDEVPEALERLARALLIEHGADGLTEVERERQRLIRIGQAHRARIALLVNSYDQEDVLMNVITRHRPDLLPFVRILIRDNDPPELYGPYGIQRNRVSEFPEEDAAWILIANFPAFGRAHNVVLPNGEAAISSAYHLVRPMPVPDDPERQASHLNASMLDYLRRVPALPMAEAFPRFRRTAWSRYSEAWNTPSYMAGMSDPALDALYWYLVVIHQQMAGRFIRRGTSAFLHFCDAAYLPRPDATGLPDRGSVLIGMRRVLQAYIDGEKGGSAERLATALYGAFYEGLCELGDMI